MPSFFTGVLGIEPGSSCLNGGTLPSEANCQAPDIDLNSQGESTIVSEKFKHQSELLPQAHHVTLTAGLSEWPPPWARDVYFLGHNVGAFSD